MAVDCAAPVTAGVVSENDVSGIGVVIGFMLMAWTPIAILALHYIVAYNPHDNPFRALVRSAEDEKSGCRYTPNAVDVIITGYFPFRRWLRSAFQSAHTIELAFNKYVLGLADAQLVTGLAIMTSGYYCLSQGLSGYHWNTIVYLAWFACLTHLAALSFLRTYLHNNPIARAWRLALMTIVFVLLFVGFIPTGHFNFVKNEPDVEAGPRAFDSGAATFECTGYHCRHITNATYYNALYTMTGSPAACFFRGDMDTYGTPFVSMVLSLVLLVYSYVVRVGKLFQSSSSRVSSALRGTLDKGYDRVMKMCEAFLLRRWPGVAYVLGAILLPLIGGLYYTFRLLMDLWSSNFMEVCSLIIASSWGTSRLAEIRDLGNYEDDRWSFGQVMPLVLFTLPLISLIEILLPLALHSVYEHWQRGGNLMNMLRPVRIDKDAGVTTQVDSAQFLVPTFRGRRVLQRSYDKVRRFSHRPLEAVTVDKDEDTPPHGGDGPSPGISRESTLIVYNSSATPNDKQHALDSLDSLDKRLRHEVAAWFHQTRHVYTTKAGLMPILVICMPLLYNVVQFLLLGGELLSGWLLWRRGYQMYSYFLNLIFFVPFCVHICMAYIISTMWAFGIRDDSKWRHLVRFIDCLGYAVASTMMFFNVDPGPAGFAGIVVGGFLFLTTTWSLTRLVRYKRAQLEKALHNPERDVNS